MAVFASQHVVAVRARWRIVFAVGLVCLTTTSAASGSEWPHVVRYGPLVVHADFDLHPLAPLFREIVAMQAQLQAQLGVDPAQEHIDVYLFSRRSAYLAYMQRYFPGIAVRKAMFVKSNSPGNVFAHASLDVAVDLRHECTHALLHASLPMVPLWLDEGLAEYYEVPLAEREDGNPYLKTVKRNVYWRRPTALTELESIRRLDEMGTSEYRDAWSWVHFMLHGPPAARRELREYLAEIANHSPPEPLSARLHASMQHLERAYVRHFRR